MKIKFLPLVAAFLFFGSAKTYAQFEFPVEVPQQSQLASVFQTVGVTGVDVEYSRPSVRGRKIFGKLVPYGQVWRAGANANTTISFTTEVKIDGKTVPAGKYGLHIIPTENEWTMILNQENSAWGSYFYEEGKDVIRFKVSPKEIPFTEQVTYDFTDVQKNSAVLNMSWETTEVSFKIEADTDKLAVESFRKQLNSRPWWGWTGPYKAAEYCYDNNVNLDQALEWVNRSIRNQENFSNTLLKSKLLKTLGKTEEAKTEKEKAFSLATVNDLTRFAYYEFLKKNNKEGMDALKVGIKNYPKNASAYNAVAWGYTKIEDNKNALKYYKKALKYASKEEKEKIQKAINKLQS
ncbi:DUF2911 domain-containing protein [Aureivirga sp. CE67]|uniref:DUF2911 domain-containing protein n=1 Tax=Aureivirga sp. CE67 TaxID=1788983 RepID=UPI0018CB39BF|nr:DUF2911 domain-containing protein [Aureivirga sp. CE67]